MKKILLTLMFVLGFSAMAAAADTAPAYPGGDKAMTKFINDNLTYPASAKDNGIEGVVGVIFTVKADGTIGNIKIKRMVDPDLESEAVRIVKKMPKWTPGTKDGVAVDAPAEVNVTFTLE